MIVYIPMIHTWQPGSGLNILGPLGPVVQSWVSIDAKVVFCPRVR